MGNEDLDILLYFCRIINVQKPKSHGFVTFSRNMLDYVSRMRSLGFQFNLQEIISP